MAENKEMNVKLADEELDVATGGEGWNKEWWKKRSHTRPKFDQYVLVKRKGYEQYGIAEIKGIDYIGPFKKGTFVYNIAYAGQPVDVTRQYGFHVPENELYKI